MYVAVGATVLSIIASVLAAYAIVRLRFKGADTVGGADLLCLSRAAVDPVHSAGTVVIQAYGLFDSPLALILTYPTLLIPFSTWLLMGYFKTIPFELEECALIDGACRWQILTKIVLPLAVPGLISAFIFCFTLCWNEFIYALTFLQSAQNKTVPVAIVNEFVDGDIYRWGSLMAGALVGSLPLVILYAFFVEHYVSAMTGAVKELTGASRSRSKGQVLPHIGLTLFPTRERAQRTDLVQRRHFLRRELPPRRRQVVAQLRLVARADDDGVDPGLVHHPVQRHLRGRDPALAANLRQRVDDAVDALEIDRAGHFELVETADRRPRVAAELAAEEPGMRAGSTPSDRQTGRGRAG